MPNVRDYQNHCDDRRGYGWRPLDFMTWLSWHLNVPLAKMKHIGR